MQELVEDGRTGLHFTAGNSADLTRKVTWAWSQVEAMRGMGKAARREYETKYTPEKNYPLLMDIYRSAGVPQATEIAVDAELDLSLSRS